MVIKISDIVGFFRRLLGLRKPEKAGEDIPLEKQEILEEKEKVEEKNPLTGKGEGPAEKEKKTEEKKKNQEEQNRLMSLAFARMPRAEVRCASPT